MKVTVIIAHDPKRPEKMLQHCVMSVRKSIFYERMQRLNFDGEIIVTDEPSKVFSRNHAAEKAKGKILLFIDDDAIATDSWIHEILKPFERREVAVVGGPTVLMPGSDLREDIANRILGAGIATWRSSARHYPKGQVRQSDESEITSCNMAVRKSVFVEVGGFPDIVPCEENALINNIQTKGYKIVYTPLAIVHHNRAPLFLPYAKKLFYYGKGRGRFIRKRGLKARPKLVGLNWKANIIFFAGLIVHYIAYFSGLVWGLIKK